MTEALSWMHAPTNPAVEIPRKGARLRCSFCQAELGDNLELTIPGEDVRGKSAGAFCSAHCHNCVLALAALHPSPLAPDEFVSRRGVLTDRLLDLWRNGRGPDPVLVRRAAERAGCEVQRTWSQDPATATTARVTSAATKESVPARHAVTWYQAVPAA